MKIARMMTAFLLAPLLLLTGCSLFAPSHQQISVRSPQPHAQVWINGAFVGEAPVQASVKRNATLMVVVKKDGYAPSTRVIYSRLSPTGVLDCIGACVFLVPGLGFCSAGAFALKETDLNIDLAPGGAAEPATEPVPGNSAAQKPSGPPPGNADLF